MAKSKVVTHFMSNDNVRTNDTAEVPLQETTVNKLHMNFRQIFKNVLMKQQKEIQAYEIW